MTDEPSIVRARYARDYGIELGEGNGASRRCYWDRKSKWAYKFIIVGEECNNPKANLEEWQHYSALDTENLGIVKVPEMKLLSNGILAIEYIEGNHPANDCWTGYHECGDIPECWYNRINGRRMARNIKGFHDISPFNVIETTSGNIYVIDLEW